jgi:pyridoxamine 5'-phosphate oxidase
VSPEKSTEPTDEDRLRSRLRALPVLDGAPPSFDTDNAPGQPAELFLEWLVEAIDAGVREPHAMTLATVDTAGRPSSRVLILKGLADGQWQFATSRDSRKGRELARTPWAAASFYWPEIARQVRLRGRVLDGGAEEAARDFLARPAGSRAESLPGHQSQILSDRADLDAAIEEAHALVLGDPNLVPGHWALFNLAPDEVEFWQGDAERRHTRLRYELEQGRWERRLLWP